MMDAVLGYRRQHSLLCATVLLTIFSISHVEVEARNFFGGDEVHIPEDVSKWVMKTLTEMNAKFDKDPLQTVEFQCKNRATERLMSMFPDAVIRWMHNGENIKIRPASMMMSMDSLIVQNLLPRDSGVYHCVVMVTPKQPVVTAVYSLVVGENWIHVFPTGKLKLSCNSRELASLFRDTVRTWVHLLGKKTAPAIKEEAVFYNIDAGYNGTWTCIVTDRQTKRTWVTARYKVIVDPPPPFLVRLKIRVMDNKLAAFGIVFGVLFFCMVIYEGLVERFRKKNDGLKKEMDFFKTALHLEVPATEAEDNEEEQPLLQSDTDEKGNNKLQ